MSFNTEFAPDSEPYRAPPSPQSQDRPSKRKRNKPTLSCGECVERKTKCDRGRPQCLACIRRKTPCTYAIKADTVKQGGHTEDRDEATPQRRFDSLLPSRSDSHGLRPDSSIESVTESMSRLNPTSPPNQALLSNIPYSLPKASNIYGIGSEHPFNNYWTLTGGLAEVVSVLPSKAQADILVARFFESVDPVYPLVHQSQFYAKYEAFWQLPFSERANVDTSFVALILVMLAMGTQFLRLPGDPLTAQQSQTSGAEFYASACHQALRLGAYLNRASVQTLQAMVLMTYFLMNASHASDAWAFAGVIIRQAYAIGLNRDSSLLYDPNLTILEKLERKRLWHGIVCQDAFMSVILRLPPGATHADIDQAGAHIEGWAETPPGTDSSSSSPEARRISTPTSISDSSFDAPNDLSYVKGMYTLALLVQQCISSPRSLSLPMAASPEHRVRLISRFVSLRQAWPEAYKNWTEHAVYEFCHGPEAERRLARQIFILNSNYWHCVMLVWLEGCEHSQTRSNGVGSDDLAEMVASTLHAAHEALNAFFVMHALLEDDAGTWWVMAHRAFTGALTAANLLKIHAPLSPPTTTVKPETHLAHSQSRSNSNSNSNPSHFIQARLDVLKMIAILRDLAAQDEISRTRVEVLEATCGT